MSDAEAFLVRRSQEIRLKCDRDGMIRERDARARQLLECEPGASLLSLAAGAEAKVKELIRRAQEEELVDWELGLCVGGRAETVVCSTMPIDGGFELLGFMVPARYRQALDEVRASMSEMANLHREIARQKRELERLNRDLTDSSRGILALHSELEGRAEQASASAEVKGRMVANVSHEFRTPIHSIRGLAGLLLERVDGPLTPEQEKQVRFIRTAADELGILVDDLLDMSKLEAGAVGLRAGRFSVDDLLSSLRGMTRPLVMPEREVELIIEDPPDGLELETDRGKVAQVLRNLVSNALKFTEEGQVRVSTDTSPDGYVRFVVEDTGIGIAPEDHERIFEEFVQIETPMAVKGTGLGLAICRKMAELLGGRIDLESAPGRGSKFTLLIPPVHEEIEQMRELEERSRKVEPDRIPLLVVEDDRKTLFIYERYLAMGGFHVFPARTVDDARAILRDVKPAAILLDIMLEGEASWQFLHDLKTTPATCDIPVLVATVTNREKKARAIGADEFWLKPIDAERLIRKLHALTEPGPADILVIDDDERARYLMRKLLEGTRYSLFEASTGAEGIELARARNPQAIFLDFLLEEMTAFDVLDDLKSNPATRGIPVIIITSHVLSDDDRARLLDRAETVLAKESLSRELAIHRIHDALRKSRRTPEGGGSVGG